MRALVLLSLLVALPCAAQPVSVAPWMTGERLLALAGPVNPADIAWRPGGILPNRQAAADFHARLNRERLQAYIAGVHDATEGERWCYGQPYKPKPDVLEDAAIDGLRALPAGQRKRDAASLIVEVWRKTWPCANRSEP